MLRMTELISSRYRVDAYRLAHSDPAHDVHPPCASELDTDSDVQPPLEVKQSGRPPASKGPRKRKRIPSRGEHFSSSVYNTMTTPLPVSGTASGGASARTGGTAHSSGSHGACPVSTPYVPVPNPYATSMPGSAGPVVSRSQPSLSQSSSQS